MGFKIRSRNTVAAALCLFALTGTAPCGDDGPQANEVQDRSRQAAAVRGYVVTTHTLRADLERLARDHDLRFRQAIPALRAALLEGTQAADPAAVLAKLRGDARVAGASENVRFDVAADCCGSDTAPDPQEMFAAAHRRLERSFGPIHGRAGDLSTVVVAVLDTGIDAAHSDLRGALIPGRSFVEGAPWNADGSGHGTAMASLVAAQPAQAGKGLEGVARGAKVLPVRVADKDGRATLAEVAAGVVYAVDRGASVVLLSLGARLPAPALDDAIAYAERRGVLVVAAAGNRNTNQDLYPAADARVLSVGCVEDSGRLAFSTALAPTTDLLAPGVEQLACLPKDSHALVTGSSAAAARVAGVAAIVRGLRPGLSPALVRSLLKGATRPLPLFAAQPDVARVFRAGILDPARLVRELDRTQPQLTLADPRVLPAKARAGDAVVCSVRVENRGLRSTPASSLSVSIGAVSAGTLAVPALAPGAETRLSLSVRAPASGRVTFRSSTAGTVACSLAPSETPARDLAIANLVAATGADGGLTLTATVEGRGLTAEGGQLEARLGSELLVGRRAFTPLGAGQTVAVQFTATAQQVRAQSRSFLATVTLVNREPDDATHNDAGSLDLMVPSAAPRPAKTQYQQNGKLNIIADAPFRLAPGRTYLPVLLFAAEKGDMETNTWIELDKVTIWERATAERTGSPNTKLFEDIRGGATTAVATNVIVCDEDGQPQRRGGRPDRRLFQHDRLYRPGRYAIVRLPRDVFGIAPVPTAPEDRFVEVAIEWTNRRKFLFVFGKTHTGTQRWTLRTTFAADARPQLPGGGAYYDAHVHTVAEWHQEDTINPIRPRKNLGGPIPMVKEASHAIGLTDAVDAVRGRLITTDHNAFLNDGDSLKERPPLGPTSAANSNGKGEFDRYRELLGLTASEEVTFAGTNKFLWGINLPTGSHMLTYRAQHIVGPWHGGSNLARTLGDPLPDVVFADLLKTLTTTNRQANAQAATFAAHPYSGSMGWKDEHFQLAFERDPAQRTDLPVHQEQTGFVTKGIQIWNADGERHTMPKTALDWDDVNPWKNAKWQQGDPDWDTRLYTALSDYHKTHLAPLLEYELKGRPGVRFPRKVLVVAGNDAHGDFNFATNRQGTIIPGSASMKYRAYGRVLTYAMPRDQTASTPNERAFEAFLDGQSIVTDGPLCTVSIDGEDRFDGTHLAWHDARRAHEDKDGQIGGGGDFDGAGTALVPRGSAHVRFGYRYTNTSEFGSSGDIQAITIYRTSVGDPNPSGTKPSGSPFLVPRGTLAPGGADQDLEEAIDAGQEGLIDKPSAVQVGAFTAVNPAAMGADEHRCFTNPIWLMPFDVKVAVNSTATNNGRGEIPAGELVVTFEFDMSLTPKAYKVELKALDGSGDSSDQATGPIDELVPVSGNGWSDRGAIKNGTFTVTNQRAIPLDLDRYPAGGNDVTFVVYFYERPQGPFGNQLNRIAATFSAAGIGTGGGTGPAIPRSGTTAPGSTQQGSTAAPGRRSGGGGCALTSDDGRPFGAWPLALLLGLLLLRGRRARA